MMMRSIKHLFPNCVKRHRSIAFILVLLLIFGCTAKESNAQTVYITKTGTKYHKSTCQYLRYSKYPVKLSEAKARGYTPCSVCKPTTIINKLDTVASDTVVHRIQTPEKKVQATQCTAMTKAGTRCKRTTTNANGRCWQHQ